MAKFSGALLASAGALATLLLGFAPASANKSVIKGGQDPDEWAVYGKDYANTRYSPLKSINTRNVVAISSSLTRSSSRHCARRNDAALIGDTPYVSTSWAEIWLCARRGTGARKWTYEPDMPDDTLQFACCDVDSRGVAYADGKIFVGRLDGKLVALDAKTGKELWKSDVVDYTQGSVISSPPLVVKNLVITGFGGGEYGARGALQAYDINTGKQVWKTCTVPLKDEPNGDTWKGDPPSTAAARRGWSAPTIPRPTPFSGARPIPARGTPAFVRPATATSAS